MSIYCPRDLPNEYYKRPIDVLARRTHFIDHIAPVWKHLPNKGKFYIPESLYQYTMQRGISPTPLKAAGTNPLNIRPPGNNVLFTCAYDDLENGVYANIKRPLIFMEHGVGLTFGKHPSYAGGRGMRKRVHLFLAPNKFIFNKTKESLPGVNQAIIGTPKMDLIPEMASNTEHPNVVISFHWDGHMVEPEAGNAFAYYRKVIPELAEKYHVVGHAHPRIQKEMKLLYNALGVSEFWTDFYEVLYRGDIYINDCSSTAYEFAVTGKPVILLNAPQFRKQVNWGIRFWDYTDFAPMVDNPGDLISILELTLKYPHEHVEARKKMVKDLYPYKGDSAFRAAEMITKFLIMRSEGNTEQFEVL